jgi:hypothetical protein
MIGVCIKYFHENYGGMLQAFATTQYLEDMGYDYELIRYKKKINIGFLLKSLPRLFNRVLLNDKFEMMKKKIGAMQHREYARNDAIRMAAFESFKKEHFTKLSQEYVGYDQLCAGAEKYRAVITGSDQLWSPAGLPTNFYNLRFVPDRITKISFASSFGVNEIPWYQKKRTKDYLERIEHVSMRENRGSEIVKELTGREVPILMDPVFAFEKEKWEKLIPCSKPEWEHYIFCYFLGDNPAHRIAAKELAKNTGKKIVTLRHLDQYVPGDEKFGDYAPYDVDPVRFLNILRNADYVCTDSFHGTAFSIICEKQFLVFNRYSEQSSNSKNSRIDSVCYNLHLESRRFYGGQNMEEVMNAQIDYQHVRELLQQYRGQMQEYLQKAIAR